MFTCVTRSDKHMYVRYFVNDCVMVLIIVVNLTCELGSVAKWENGWLAKWPRRLEAEVLEIRSSKGESKERDWKFEEVSGETFWLKVWNLSWLLCESVIEWLVFYCFWVVYGVTWQVTLGSESMWIWWFLDKWYRAVNKYYVKWPAVSNKYVVLN